MFQQIKQYKNNFLSMSLARALVCVLTLSLILMPSAAQAQSVILPAPGAMVMTSPAYNPAIITGLTVYPDDPLKFDFIIDTGDDRLEGEALKEESQKLVNYFMAALTVPEDEMWVNLSPYEKDRIIADGLSHTEMGRDMLAQDYLLKQLSASMMYPEDEFGRKFWKRVHKKAREQFGTAEIPTNTFNKIWIVPDEAEVFVHGNNVFVAKNHLKVMLEEDYLALEANQNSTKHGLGDVTKNDLDIISGVSGEIVREILLPEIEREVNEGENFANLRQMYNSMLLATWYKKQFKESVLNKIYANQNKLEGIALEDNSAKQQIYDQYVEAFEKGVFNYIKEDVDTLTQEVIPRKYFSGGLVGHDTYTQTAAVPISLELADARPHAGVSIEGKVVPKEGGSSSPVESVLKESGFEEIVSNHFFHPDHNRLLVKIIKQNNQNIGVEIYTNYSAVFTASVLKSEYRDPKEIMGIDIVEVERIAPALKLIYSNGDTDLSELWSEVTAIHVDVDNFRSLMGLTESKTPLLDNLTHIGFREIAPETGVYSLSLRTVPESKFILIYRDEKIIYIGRRNQFIDRLLKYNPNEKLSITDFEPPSSLTLEVGPLKYRLDEEGKVQFKSLDLERDWEPQLWELQNYQEERYPNDGFQIGGVNTQDQIRSLIDSGLTKSKTEGTPLAIEEIERRSRPQKIAVINGVALRVGGLSMSGFLGEDESFIDRLLADNRFVLSKGYTHQQLAKPLFNAMNIAARTSLREGHNLDFRYQGQLYRINVQTYMGYQTSIFYDNLTSGADFRIMNLQTRKFMKFSEMVPFYIWRYGFYEGNTEYRVDPLKIIEVFSLKPESSSEIEFDRPRDTEGESSSPVSSGSAHDESGPENIIRWLESIKLPKFLRKQPDVWDQVFGSDLEPTLFRQIIDLTDFDPQSGTYYGDFPVEMKVTLERWKKFKAKLRSKIKSYLKGGPKKSPKVDFTFDFVDKGEKTDYLFKKKDFLPEVTLDQKNTSSMYISAEDYVDIANKFIATILFDEENNLKNDEGERSRIIEFVEHYDPEAGLEQGKSVSSPISQEAKELISSAINKVRTEMWLTDSLESNLNKFDTFMKLFSTSEDLSLKEEAMKFLIADPIMRIKYPENRSDSKATTKVWQEAETFFEETNKLLEKYIEVENGQIKFNGLTVYEANKTKSPQMTQPSRMRVAPSERLKVLVMMYESAFSLFESSLEGNLSSADVDNIVGKSQEKAEDFLFKHNKPKLSKIIDTITDIDKENRENKSVSSLQQLARSKLINDLREMTGDQADTFIALLDQFNELRQKILRLEEDGFIDSDEWEEASEKEFNVIMELTDLKNEFIKSSAKADGGSDSSRRKGEDSSSPIETDPTRGGIDFNPNNVDLIETGDRLEIEFTASSLEHLSPEHITGILPVIINITPLPSILPLLGLKPRDEEEETRLSQLH